MSSLPFMDPTPQQIAGLDVLAEILDGLGGPTTFLEVAAIPKDVYTDSINLVRVAAPLVDEEPPGAAVSLTPVAKGKAQQFYRACIAKVGVVAGPSTVTTLSVQKGPKMTKSVDSALDTEIIVLTKPHLEKLFAAYRTARGEFPSEEIEPTEEQISAVHQLISTGGPPTSTFPSLALTADGSSANSRLFLTTITPPREHGNVWSSPAHLTSRAGGDSGWCSSARSFCWGFKPERLDLYGEHLRSFVTKYGPDRWFLVYQADIRMRSEHFERIRRKLQIDFDAGKPDDFGFNPKSPWDAVFAAAVKDRDFWDSEIRDKALLYLTKVSTYREAADDGTSQMSYPRGHSSPAYPQSKGQGQKRKPIHQGASKGNKSKGMGSGKGYPSSPSLGPSHEVCNNFDLGKCSEPCPNQRSHTCSKCGGNHSKERCSSQASSSKPRGKGGKGKGSKGKGK